MDYHPQNPVRMYWQRVYISPDMHAHSSWDRDIQASFERDRELQCSSGHLSLESKSVAIIPGNRADTSLPIVIAAIVRCIESFRSEAYCETSPFLNSKVSPFFGGASCFSTAFATRFAVSIYKCSKRFVVLAAFESVNLMLIPKWSTQLLRWRCTQSSMWDRRSPESSGLSAWRNGLANRVVNNYANQQHQKLLIEAMTIAIDWS